MSNEHLHAIIRYFEAIALQIPLELFVFLGMFIDEIFPPLPSLFMLIIAGAIAKTQGYTLFFLLVYLGFIGALGKVLGAWAVYFLGDKAEHFIVPRFGRAIGVTHKEIEQLSNRLNKDWKDFIILFLARAIPIFPTTPVSLICGILKINIKTYLLATFAGTWIRSMFFLYFGYAGLLSYEKLNDNFANTQAIVQILLLALLAGAYVYYKMRKKKSK